MDVNVVQEIVASSSEELRAYMQGALKDGTYNPRHRTFRIAQANVGWLEILHLVLSRLGHRSWIYREGSERSVWVLETVARFLDLQFDASTLVGIPAGLNYARGYFDAEGGMPKRSNDRLYIQFVQKNRASLATLSQVLTTEEVRCGVIHNPSVRVDPQFWRFYVLAESHTRFMSVVGSWHPRKRWLISRRLCAMELSEERFSRGAESSDSAG